MRKSFNSKNFTISLIAHSNFIVLRIFSSWFKPLSIQFPFPTPKSWDKQVNDNAEMRRRIREAELENRRLRPMKVENTSSGDCIVTSIPEHMRAKYERMKTNG